MNEQTQPSHLGLLWALLIFLGIFVAGYLVGRIHSSKGNEETTFLSPNYQREYATAQVKIEQLNQRIGLKEDTIMQLQTELAITSIRVNQSEARINELSKRIRNVSKEVKVWTPEIEGKIMDCDSLVAELQDVYINEQNSRIALADSLNVFYEAIITDKDSTIEQYKRLDTMSLKALVECETAKQKAQHNAKSLRKKAGIGWLAAAIGAFFAVVTNLK